MRKAYIFYVFPALLARRFNLYKKILTKALEFLYTPPPKVNICYIFPYGFTKGR